MAKIKNVLYTTGCPKCNVLKRKLEEKNIVFETNTCEEEMVKLGFYEAPMFKKGREIMNFTQALRWIEMQNI